MTRARTLILVVGAIAAGCATVPVDSTSTLQAEWTSYRGGALRHGARDARRVVPPLYQVWERKTGRNPLVEPILVGDHLVVPTSDRQIRIVECETGRSGWRKKVGGVPSTGLVAADGVVVIGHLVPKPGLTALSLVDGSVRWMNEDIRPRGGPAIDDGTIYLSDVRRGLTACELATGDTLWTRAVPSRWPAPLALESGVLVAADESDSLRAFRAADGEPLWVTEVPGGVRSAPAVTSSAVFVCTSTGALTRLSLDDGSVSWTRELGARVYAPLLVRGEDLYVTALNGGFLRIDAVTGETRWIVRVDGACRAGVALVGDVAVVPTMKGACQLVSLSEARILHTVDLKHAIRAGVIVAGRYIYAVDEGGTLVAYESS
jgi:outer membrane protein assembly factor BamB